MRMFEIVLILVNMSALGLNFIKQSKAVWLKIAGANLFVLLSHGIFEGLRYQMAFSYLFVVIFVMLTLIKTTDGFFEAKVPKALKIITGSISFVFLMLTVFLAYALPVFKLPKPTGSYA